MIPIFFIVLLPIIIAVTNYLFVNKIYKVVQFLGQALMMVIAISYVIAIKDQGTIIQVLGGYEQGVGITLKIDSISSVFVLLNTFLFSCLLLYNYHKSYMTKLFLFLFIILQGLINGLFLANDLFTLYVIIELSTIVVSILIMFKRDSQSIYDGMLYLLINIVSMSMFLLAIAYIYKIFGTLDLTILKERMDLVVDPRILILPYALLITSVDLKSALMPLFSWLPKAHGTKSAPSIVSAILSGLYVKGGLYLFIRFQDVFKSQIDTAELFILMGFLTSVIGFTFALSQTDLKLILAYHTVSQIGLIIFGLSIGNEYSYWGSIYHIVNHAIFKSLLFLTAGMIIDEYGTRDIREIKGVFKRMPFVSVVTLMAIFAITGAPLFNGSISKYLIQKGLNSNTWLEYALLIINLGTVMSFVKYASMFRGDYEGVKHHLPLNQKIAISILGTICLLGGIFGIQFVDILFGVHVSVSMAGYLEKTVLFIISLIIGVLFYHFLYKKIGLFRTIREIELTFNQICYSIVIFFAMTMVYLMIVV